MLPAVLAVAGAVALGISPVWDYDVWFHLACGRDLVAARGIPAFDTLSYTAAGRPWDAHEWLFDVLLYGLWRAGGAGLLIAVKAALAGRLGWLLYRRTTRASAEPGLRWVAAAFVVWGLWVCRWSIVERPQLVTFVLLSLELLWLEAGRTPWALVPLQVLWANLHGGSALLGPGVLVLHRLGAALDSRRSGTPWQTLRMGWTVPVAMTAALAATPSGLRLFTYPFTTMRDTMYLANIVEWMPPTRAENPEFFVWFAVCAALTAVAVRRIGWAELAVAVPLALLPWSARRHIPLAGLVLVPLAARSAAWLLARPLAIRGFAPALAGAVAVGLIGHAARKGEALRTGIRDDLFPAAVIPVLREARPALAPGRDLRVYALHRWGGYCAWWLPPEFKTFIDGRQLVFGPELFADYYRMLEDLPGAPELIDRYAPDVFVLNYGTRLSQRLAADPRFALVHWDDTAVVYVRRAVAAPGWLAAHAYVAFHPEAGTRGDPGAALAEVNRAAGESPGHTRPLIARSRLLLGLGRRAEALASARAAVAAAPDSPAVLLGAMDAALAGGDHDLAGEWIARARHAGAATEDAGLAAAKRLLARGDAAAAERELGLALAAAEARQIITHTPPGPLAEICVRLAAIRRAAGDVGGAALLLRKAGNARYLLGDYPGALAAYREGLTQAPVDAKLRHNVGTALLALGRIPDAIAAFRHALAADPAQPDTWAALGQALNAAHRPADARGAWQHALALDPSRADVRQALASLPTGAPAPP